MATFDTMPCLAAKLNDINTDLLRTKYLIPLLGNELVESDTRPIEEGCGCPACQRFSRAYVRHLLKAGEMLGLRLAVLHNLYFYNKLMERIREALDAGCFAAFRAAYSEKLSRKI